MFFKKKLTEKNLVGIWKHPILASWVRLEVSGVAMKPIQNYNMEIINFRANGTFTIGEYGKSGPLYEGSGRWVLSTDKTTVLITYDNGVASHMDIREFNGHSFITTSVEGNDLMFTKQ